MYKTKSVIFLILLSLCNTLKAEELSKRYYYDLVYMVTRFYDIDTDDISSVKLIKGGKVESNITDIKQISEIYLLDPTFENDAEGKPEYLPNSYTYILTYRENGDTEGKEKSEGINNGYIYVNVEEDDGLNEVIPCKKITLMNPPTTFERMAEPDDNKVARSFSFSIPVFQYDDDGIMARMTEFKELLNQKGEDGKPLIDKGLRDDLLTLENDAFDDFCTVLFFGKKFPYLPLAVFGNIAYNIDDMLFKGQIDYDTSKRFLNIVIPSLIEARNYFALSATYYASLNKIFYEKDSEFKTCDMLYSLNLAKTADTEMLTDLEKNYKKFVLDNTKVETKEDVAGVVYYSLLKWRIHSTRGEEDKAKEVIDVAKKKLPAEEGKIFDLLIQQKEKISGELEKLLEEEK